MVSCFVIQSLVTVSAAIMILLLLSIGNNIFLISSCAASDIFREIHPYSCLLRVRNCHCLNKNDKNILNLPSFYLLKTLDKKYSFLHNLLIFKLNEFFFQGITSLSNGAISYRNDKIEHRGFGQNSSNLDFLASRRGWEATHSNIRVKKKSFVLVKPFS